MRVLPEAICKGAISFFEVSIAKVSFTDVRDTKVRKPFLSCMCVEFLNPVGR